MAMSAPDFSMLVIAAIASIAAGLAYSVLIRDEPGFVAAKILAWLSAIGFGSLGIIWGSSNMAYPLPLRMTAAFIVAGIAAAALTWVISDINGQNKKADKAESGELKIVLAGDGPFSTVAPAGVNRRRTVRVKIENNTDNQISNATLRASNLDPAYRNQTDFLLKSDLAIPAHGHIFVDVAYFDEGSSQGLRGRFMYLVLPAPPPFAEAIPTLPTLPHTFYLKFSTLEGGLFAEIYCRLYVDEDHILRLEDAASLPKRQGASKIEPVASEHLALYEAMVRVYEALEERPYGIAVYGLNDTPDDRLTWLCNAIFRYVNGEKPLATLYGTEPPSRNPKPLMMEAYSNYDFQIVNRIIVLVSRHNQMTGFENLSVDSGELETAIKVLAAKEV